MAPSISLKLVAYENGQVFVVLVTAARSSGSNFPQPNRLAGALLSTGLAVPLFFRPYAN